MSLNLLTDRWIPVRRGDGTTATIAPWELVPPDDDSTAPPVDIAPPRADFRAALFEFCIGLLQVTVATQRAHTKAQWLALWRTPPTQKDLRAAFADHARWFNLTGERPLFMQDFTLPPPGPRDERLPVSSLLIDAPAKGSFPENTDLFVKRNRTESLCLACAGLALYTMQTYAPEGGRSYYTSLRGGGPLTSLAIPQDANGAPVTLWHTLWLNVLPLREYGRKDTTIPEEEDWPGKVYPWAAPTRMATKYTTEPGDVHPFQSHWGMPRRILLLSSTHNAPISCSLCGMQTHTTINDIYRVPSGTNYGPSWKHPLSPYRHLEGEQARSIKGKSDINGYTYWLGMIYGEGGTNSQERSDNVNYALSINDLAGKILIRASGYQMKKNKPLQWCEGEYPVFTVPPEQLDEFRSAVRECVTLANTAKAALLGALRLALYPAGNAPKTDNPIFHGYAATFWGRTEAAFYDTVKAIAKAGANAEANAEADAEATPKKIAHLHKVWAVTLMSVAEDIFHSVIETQAFDVRTMVRVADARNILHFGLRKNFKSALNPS